MDNQTFRLLEQTQKQMMAGMIPKINVPTIDVAKMSMPTVDPAAKINAQLSKQAESLLESTAKWESMGSRISAKVALDDLFPGPGATQALANLNRTFQPPTIADYLAKNSATSIFSYNEPTIAEQLGARIDTKALMGLAGLADTAGKISEQWRLANTGALSSFGESFNSLSAALGFNETLKASPAARSFLFKARTLQEDQVLEFADTAPPKHTEEKLSAELAENKELSFVVKHVQNYFVSYLYLTPDQAQNIVKWILYLMLFGAFLAIYSQTETILSPTAELALEVGAVGVIGRAGTKGSKLLIPSAKKDEED